MGGMLVEGPVCQPARRLSCCPLAPAALTRLPVAAVSPMCIVSAAASAVLLLLLLL